MMSLIKCRKCGSEPKLIGDREIMPGDTLVAIYCPADDCYNDTHWQFSWHAATKIWNANPVPVDIRGGQGDSADDDNVLEFKRSHDE